MTHAVRMSAARCPLAALALIVAMMVAGLPGRPGAETVLELPFKLAVGQRFAIEIRREIDRRDDETADMQLIASTPVVAEVTERLADGWVLVWTYGATTFQEGDVPLELADRTLATIADGLRLEFTVDGGGTPVEVRNDSEVRRHLRRFAARYVNTQVRAVRETGGSYAEIARVRREARVRTTVYLRMSDDGLDAFILDDPATLYRISGHAYAPGEVHETIVERLDPVTDEIIRSIDRARLSEVDPRSGVALVEWWRDVDREAAGPGADGAAAADPTVPLDDRWTAVYSVDTESGLVATVTAERTITSGSRRLHERTILSQSRAGGPTP